MTIGNRKAFLIIQLTSAIVFLIGIPILLDFAIDCIQHGLEKPTTWANFAAFTFAGISFLLVLMLVHLFIRSLRSIFRMSKQINSSTYRDNGQAPSNKPPDVSKVSTFVSQNKPSKSEEDK